MINIINKYRKISAILLAIAIGYLIGFLSIYFFDEYGWTVFVLVPLLLGCIPVVVYGYKEEISLRQSIELAFVTLSIFCFSTLLFAVEGIICIIMASPILAFFTWLGALIGHHLIKDKKPITKQMYSVVLLPVAFLMVDTHAKIEEHLEVKTTITINAPIEEVWENVITFGQIEEPKEWIFKTGISYPTHAEIKGHGVGAVRYCNFTTGSFVEPITTWDAPTLLQFDVLEQPTPMRELNPFWDVHPPHLDGYFQSKKGQFALTQLTDGQTKVEGTTWYNIHIHPVTYWDSWSKYILHEIHYRVLRHIKTESERPN